MILDTFFVFCFFVDPYAYLIRDIMHEHIIPVLQSLPWLPVRYRIDFIIILILVSKWFSTLTPL